MTEARRVGRSANGTPLFECICEYCGAVRHQDRRRVGTPCRACYLKLKKERAVSGTRLYRVWSGMIARCTYPSASHYEYYGGRGIDVCSEWRNDKERFFSWALKNGYTDTSELDRRDVDGPYEPANCRFISHQENSQLRSNARCNRVQAGEVKRLLQSGVKVKDAAMQVGIPYMSAWHISKGNTWHNA